ncbi:hypothetical protein VRB50_21720 [Pseudomonas poae]|uniref:hypothetical protein n=1 Tax=Pseudomonas poae TaxID=200451 RepID=UPI0030D3BAB2
MNNMLLELSTGVPEVFTSFDGYRCNFADGRWTLNRNITVNIGLARALMSSESYEGLCLTLKFYAANASAAHTQNLFDRYHALLKFGRGEVVTPNLIVRYRRTLESTHEWYLGAIRVLVKQWHRLDYPGLHPELSSFLTDFVLPANRKGEAVKQLDPEKGPLSDIELLGFNDEVVQAYEVGSISITELALSLLASHTGSRPLQLTNTRLEDLSDDSNDQGEQFFSLQYRVANNPARRSAFFFVKGPSLKNFSRF